MAFPKQNRLRKSSLITLLCKKGASWKTPFFRIKYFPVKFGESQIVIITSKKLDKRAVYRNKIRRKLSGCFEDVLLQDKNLKIKKNMLLVIFPTEKTLSANYLELLSASKFSLENIQKKLLYHSHDNKKQSRKTRSNTKPNSRNI